MAVIINNNNSIFKGDASNIRNYYDHEKIDFEQIQEELRENKKRLVPNTIEYEIVEELASSADRRDIRQLTASAAKFAGQVSSAALAGLLGSYLKNRLGL